MPNFMDGPFSMEPRRQVPGLFSSPLQSPAVGASPSVNTNGPNFRAVGPERYDPRRVNIRPAAPAPAPAGKPRAMPSAPALGGGGLPVRGATTSSGPYSYSGPTMTMLNPTQLAADRNPPPVAPATPMGGRSFVDNIFSGPLGGPFRGRFAGL